MLSALRKLRAEFLLEKGDLFARDKVASGLEGIRNLYGSQGFIDFTSVPDTEILSDSVARAVTVQGPQYCMGKLDVVAKKELADKLRAQWQLAEGAGFDSSYIEKYVKENHALLPLEFTQKQVNVVRNCPEA